MQAPERQWVKSTKCTFENGMTSVPFIKEHRLWEGFKSYSWLIKGLGILGIILGLKFASDIWTFLTTDSLSQDSMLNASSLISSFSDVALSGYFDGGLKYVILIALEIVIFHFTRRALEALTGDKKDTSFKAFITAEKRVIKVALFSFFMESVCRFVGYIVFSIFGYAYLEPYYMFFITSFYLGFAVVDNYNEVYELTIKESHRLTQHFAPVAIIVGAMINVLLNLPLIGLIVSTVLGAVIATLTMHHLTNGGRDLAWVKKKKIKKRRKKKVTTA